MFEPVALVVELGHLRLKKRGKKVSHTGRAGLSKYRSERLEYDALYAVKFRVILLHCATTSSVSQE